MGTEYDTSEPQAQAEARKSPELESPKAGKDRNAGSAGGHRKSLSGGLSQFSFLRLGNNNEHGGKPHLPASPASETPAGPRMAVAAAGSAMAVAGQQKTARKRKGSLRKTALLGTGKMRTDAKDRLSVSTPEDVRPPEDDQGDGFATDPGSLSTPSSPKSPIDVPTPRPSAVPPPVPMVTHPVHGDPAKISSAGTRTGPITASTITYANRFFPRKLPWPAGRGSTAQSTASTTDDEESPTSESAPLQIGGNSRDSLARAVDSYFPPIQPRVLPRPRPTTPKSRSPLAALPPTSLTTSASPTALVEWDYSETRWWGWLILCVTWIVFVVGMGSCLEVWSWAWDVGETPYAPPELNDDPTLPIVGYYPALMVLTSVMAWVWVVVAWVGMKYFKHASIGGDEDLR